MEQRETGWLLEEFVNGRAAWLKAYKHEDAEPFLLSPTHDASEALRFARKCDAEVFLHNLKRLHACWAHCFVTDHEWIGPVAQGIEARSDETRRGSAVGESPVHEVDAPNA